MRFRGITRLNLKRHLDGPEIAQAYRGKDAMQQSAELLDYHRLEAGSVLDVETRSRHYRIECLGGDSIRISGHPRFCPEPVPARLEGSLNREGELESGFIECGARLLFVIEDRLPVTTSKVLHVHRESIGN